MIHARAQRERVINSDAFTEGFKEKVAPSLGLEERGGIVIDWGEAISKAEAAVEEEAARVVTKGGSSRALLS